MKHHIIVTVAAILSSSAASALNVTNTAGVVYTNTVIRETRPDGIKIMYSGGIAFLPFAELPETVRQEHGYDPEKSAEFRKVLVEHERKAAEKAAARPPSSPIAAIDPVLDEKAAPVLVGRDLIAFKLARAAASDFRRRDLDIQPDPKTMTKTAAGDWEFRFSYTATIEPDKDPKRLQPIRSSSTVVRIILVKVVDYQSEIRVESCGWEKTNKK